MNLDKSTSILDKYWTNIYPSLVVIDERSPRHPIRVVSRRTGLKQDLIRAWERRYGAVAPKRTSGKHRLYSDFDIDRLTLLRSATLLGRNISQIAQLSNEELQHLIDDDERASGRALGFFRPSPQTPRATQHLEACLIAVQQLNAARLEYLLGRAEVELSRVALIEELLGPMMRRIGDLWSQGQLRPMHEHLATAVIRSFLGNFRSAFPTSSNAPQIIVTTPAGQIHEIGALLAAGTAAANGWQVTYLGPDLPASEIVAAAEEKRAKAIALSIVYPADDSRLGDEFLKLRHQLGSETAILVGGKSALAYSDYLEVIDAPILGSQEELREKLTSLRNHSIGTLGDLANNLAS